MSAEQVSPRRQSPMLAHLFVICELSHTAGEASLLICEIQEQGACHAQPPERFSFAHGVPANRRRVMSTHERIARDLAAVLSSAGEADWRQYLSMAVKIETRLDRQLATIMGGPLGSPRASEADEEQKQYPGTSSEKDR